MLLVSLSIIAASRWVFFLGIVPSKSMYPTIKGDDSIIIGNRLEKEFEDGDVIIFFKDGIYMVKRIAACAGETVVRGDEHLTVPENSYYVLGDNAEDSLDSRYWDDPFVTQDKVVAKVFFPSMKRK